MALIDTDGLTKTFGSVTAVNNLSLTVGSGELYGFIGPNGAGKTTTINLLTGQLQPDTGSATVCGLDPAATPKQVRERVGILPEREDPPSFLTPREYFEFVADLRDIGGVDEKIQRWADRLAYTDSLDTLHQDLSKGERQKAMITQAFLHEPDLVFIDEPLINLDPVIQETVKEFIKDYQDDGHTVFLSTHVMELAEAVCTHIGVLADGHLIAAGETAAVMEDDASLTDTFLRLVDDTAEQDAG